ncbi:MAG: tetratricopeptide repeat protein [Bacteroidia bacterium]|nr:tetratricopeptide repeat protein [Bacteroidia bacterium]
MSLLKYIFLILTLTFVNESKLQGQDSLITTWNNASKHDTVRAMAMHVYSRRLAFNNPDTTLILSNQLLQFSKERGLKKFEVGARNNIALSYYVKGEYKLAIDNYSESVTELKALIFGQDTTLKVFAKTLLGKTYNNIGNVYLDKGDYPLALDFYFQSLKVVEEMGDKKAQSIALGNVGIIYGIQKNYENSIKYFVKSLQMDSLTGFKSGMASNYSNISNLYQEKGDLKISLIYQLKSLDLRKEIGEKDGIVLSLVSLGSLNAEFGYTAERENKPKEEVTAHFNNAVKYFSEALNLAREIGEQRNEAVALMGLGNCAIKLGDPAKGVTLCENSLTIAEKIQSDGEIRDACKCLYYAHTALKNPAKALPYFERFISIRDTLNSAERIREIAQKQFEFDYTKKAAADSLRAHEQKILIQAELKNEKTRRYFLYGGLLLVIVFAAFMYSRYKISQEQKQIIEKQKTLVEEKQKEIVDSIQYAKKIQKTLLAHDAFLNQELNDYFILYKPKDIVSGDFYWATKKESRFYFAVCDSTGHGVPGAFMSLLNASLLNEAIVEKGIEKPGDIFNYVRAKLISNMSAEAQKDGMDGVLICVDKVSGEISYAAANNKPLLMTSNGALELPGDKMPIGIGERKDDFTTHNISYSKGDRLYLFTDGYADQFGGEKGKKFKHKQLEQLITEINHKSSNEKKEILNNTFEKWRGSLEQVDDVCIAGLVL